MKDYGFCYKDLFPKLLSKNNNEANIARRQAKSLAFSKQNSQILTMLTLWISVLKNQPTNKQPTKKKKEKT